MLGNLIAKYYDVLDADSLPDSSQNRRSKNIIGIQRKIDYEKNVPGFV